VGLGLGLALQASVPQEGQEKLPDAGLLQRRWLDLSFHRRRTQQFEADLLPVRLGQVELEGGHLPLVQQLLPIHSQVGPEAAEENLPETIEPLLGQAGIVLRLSFEILHLAPGSFPFGLLLFLLTLALFQLMPAGDLHLSEQIQLIRGHRPNDFAYPKIFIVKDALINIP
jgi:hypothetical protein